MFRKALALQPNSAEAHLNLGIALADQFNVREALSEFSEATRLAPDSALAHYNKGRALFDLGKSEEARTELDWACRLQPEYPSALYLLALVEKQADNIGRSTELLERLVALEPRNPESQYLLAQNRLRQGNTEAAIEHFRRAVQADPNHSGALYNLTRLLAKSDPAEAERYRRRSEEYKNSRLVGDQVQTLGNSALQAANAHDWSRAVEQMEEALTLCGSCSLKPILHRNLGLIYARKGEIVEAQRELQAALRLTPDDVDAQHALKILNDLSVKR